jgi:hypothetical protein
MITENNLKRLDNLVAKYALMDYKRANPKRRIRKDGTVKHNPYTLSPLTNEAREMLTLARKKDITQEEEEIVKAYLLKQKIIGEED